MAMVLCTFLHLQASPDLCDDDTIPHVCKSSNKCSRHILTQVNDVNPKNKRHEATNHIQPWSYGWVIVNIIPLALARHPVSIPFPRRQKTLGSRTPGNQKMPERCRAALGQMISVKDVILWFEFSGIWYYISH